MDFNGTFILVLVSFVIFMLAMKNIYFDPIFAIKDEREKKIEGDREKAKKSVEEYEKLNLEYEEELKNARRKAQQVIQKVRQEAKSEGSETIATARKKAQADLELKMESLVSWRDEVELELKPERDALVKAVISKIKQGRMAAVD